MFFICLLCQKLWDNYTILFNNVIHIGKVNNDNKVEIKTNLEAKSAFPLYFWASMAVVLAAGIADKRTHNWIDILFTGKNCKMKQITKGNMISR